MAHVTEVHAGQGYSESFGIGYRIQQGSLPCITREEELVAINGEQDDRARIVLCRGRVVVIVEKINVPEISDVFHYFFSRLLYRCENPECSRRLRRRPKVSQQCFV